MEKGMVTGSLNSQMSGSISGPEGVRLGREDDMAMGNVWQVNGNGSGHIIKTTKVSVGGEELPLQFPSPSR